MLAGFILLGYFGAFTYAAACDATRYEIPNRIILGLLALYVVACAGYSGLFDWRGGATAAAIVFVLGAAMYFMGWMGAGDVKLAAVSALWIGLDGLASYAMLLGFSGFALVLTILLVRRVYAGWRHPSPGGPEDVPRILRKGEPVPYGIAIAIASLGAMAADPGLAMLWSRLPS